VILLRVITPQDPARAIYDRHEHEGMIICRECLVQLDTDPTCDEIPAEQVEFWGYTCLMCNTKPSPGRTCGNEDCLRPLHPQWPAVYCTNRCAMLDV